MNAIIATASAKTVPATQILRRINEVQSRWDELETKQRAAVGKQRRQQFLEMLGLNPTGSTTRPVAA